MSYVRLQINLEGDDPNTRTLPVWFGIYLPISCYSWKAASFLLSLNVFYAFLTMDLINLFISFWCFITGCSFDYVFSLATHEIYFSILRSLCNKFLERIDASGVSFFCSEASSKVNWECSSMLHFYGVIISTWFPWKLFSEQTPAIFFSAENGQQSL